MCGSIGTVNYIQCNKRERMIPAYQILWDTLKITPGKEQEIADTIDKIIANTPRYLVVSKATNVPWAVVAVIHYRESSLNFSRHLHNGDKLTARTTHVPAGRPKAGTPPFTWEESAIDAMRYKSMDKITDWEVPNMLFTLEKYNGMGYNKKGLLSPYIWSFSNHYFGGKYVADGKFDPKAVDKQCGVAVLLKHLA